MSFPPPFETQPPGRNPPPPTNARGACWPDIGVQMDLNALWEYVNSLSQLHEGIRAQTQSVLHGVQTVQTRSAQEDSSPISGQVNGVLSAQSAELANLQNRISGLESQVSSLQSQNSALQSLLTEYENGISLALDKLRPYAAQHASALNAQRSHYLQLIEVERRQNLELRLEHQRWQQGLGSVAENAREALKAQGESELPWMERIAGLEAENRGLRRLCGLEVEDSEDEGPTQEGDIASQGSPEEVPHG